MAKPTIVAAPARGAYTVKGAPKGITIPKAPVAGSLVTGKAGVDFVYRPGGAQGAGYYKKAKPTPSVTGSKPTTGTDAAGSTIATPPVVTPPAPSTPYNYSAGFAADPRYAPGIASIAANQAGIGTEYGLVINRDTNASSPTYGMSMFRVPGQEAGTGTITAKINPTTGKSVYSDAAGKEYPVTDLELDVRALKPGEAGYLGGALGNAAAQSQNQQYDIGNAAAKGGAAHSGMRATTSAMETSALQGALSKLGLGAASAFRGTTDQYKNLLETIFPSQADNATALASAGTPAPTPDVAPVAPVDQGQVVGGPLSGGAKGDFVGQVKGILAIRDITPKGRIQQLESIGRTYALTPEQKKYLANEIKKFRKLSKVD